MNSVNFKIAPICIKALSAFSVFFGLSVAQAWEIDLSRRQVDFDKVQNESRLPASMLESRSLEIIGSAFDVAEPTQDLVILNTENGFVPDTLRLRQGASYKVYIVNVNGKQKNSSFILDAFSEHHNTVFGEKRMFYINPKMDGVFSFQCPETAFTGRLVVSPIEGARKPASVR